MTKMTLKCHLVYIYKTKYQPYDTPSGLYFEKYDNQMVFHPVYNLKKRDNRMTPILFTF